MRVGDFEITDNGARFKMKYVGPKPMYLTTASPNNHSWVKELLNKWYGRHEFVYKAPPWEEWIYEVPPTNPDEMFVEYCKYDAEVTKELYKAMKEKETAMEKDMKDYVGCYLKEVEFKPPYTTIFWSDDTATQVKCVDEPYDPEKGFAMAVQKKLFGRNYYKNMESIIKRDGGYEKATPLVKCIDGEYFGFEDSTAKAEEIQKLKKENEELSELIKSETARADACRRDYLRMKDMYDKVVETNRKLHQDKLNLSNGYNRVKKDLDDHKKALEVLKEHNAKLIKENENLKKENDRLLTEVNTLDAVRYGIVKTNEELKKENNNLEKMLKKFSDNKEELCVRLARAEMLYDNQLSVSRSLNGRIDDLKKAKESMAKKLAETKSLRQENAKLKLHLDALKEKYDLIERLNDMQTKAIRELKKSEISIKQIEQIKEILK